MTALISLLLVFSGAASLIYQVTWVRLLGLSLGSTSAAVSTVLTAFFLGLALGSYLTERITRNTGGSFTPYILAELLIGLSGLASLPILLNLDAALALAPAFGTSPALRFVLAIGLLLLPTLCMGATFPIMASILVRRHSEIGARISQLYGYNTLGAVSGAFLSGFVLIPAIGLDGAIMTAVALNGLVAIAATGIQFAVRLPPVEPGDDRPVPDSTRPAAPVPGNALLAAAALALTGFGSIAVQVGWTKYLAIFTGSTIYGFSAILTVFLTGLTLGSLAMQRIVDRIRSPVGFIPVALLALGATMLLTRSGLSLLPTMQAALNLAGASAWLNETLKYAAVALLLLPPTLVLGALFPLNLKVYCGGLAGVRGRIGKAYAINTIAGIAGAIFAGFIAIPAIGTDYLLFAIAAATAFFAMFWLPVFAGFGARVSVAGLVLIVVAAGLVAPGIDYRAIIASAGYDSRSRQGEKPRFLFVEEGKAGVISLTTYDGNTVKLQNNGLNESSFKLDDAQYSQRAEALLGLVPYMLHARPQNAFVVGFGAGHTTRILTLTDLGRIKVVELEPAIVNAGVSISSMVPEILSDPRVELEFNDARNSLLVRDEKFDLMISQPSHPWVAGAANVFTKEFWQIARQRLSEDGIFGQWINLFSMNAPTLKSLLAAFYQVFDHGFVLADLKTGNMILVGSMQTLTFDFERMDATLGSPAVAPIMRKLGIAAANDVLWYYSFSRDIALAAAADAIPNRDTNLRSEVGLASRMRAVRSEEDPYRFVRAHQRLDIGSYLPADPAARLAALGDYFLSWERPDMAEQVAALLERHDTPAADILTYRSLIAANKYHEAFTLFATRRDWPDEIVVDNIAALVKLGFTDRAAYQVELIVDPRTRLAQQAFILYRESEFDRIAALDPQRMAPDIWHVLAMAHTDLESAADRLVDRDDIPPQARIDIRRVLLRHAASLDRFADYRRESEKLLEEVTREIDELVAIGVEAKRSGNSHIVAAALDRINRLDFSSPKIKDLQ